MTPRLAVLAMGLAAAATGCGDGPTCASEVVVVIAAPGSGLVADSGSADGVQTDVEVRSNLRLGDEVTLTIALDGVDAATHEATADADGGALFTGVTLPTGMVELTVTGTSQECGSGQDSVSVQVGNSDCLLTVREQPTASDFYGVPVLNAGHDTGAEPGFQGNVDVTTGPGHAIELFVAAPAESSRGTTTADAAGAGSFAVSLADGPTSLRAVCSLPGSGVEEASLATAIMIDTVAPTCTLQPEQGTTIVPAMDLDGEPANGTQVLLSAHADGGDVAGESALFLVDGVGLLTPVLDDGGDTRVQATFDAPGPPDTQVSFRAQDHAGNACQIDRAFAYETEGCAITITDPAGPITGDANGDPADGLQYDLEITVDPACAGQTVSSDCELDGVATGVVPGDGQLTMRVTVCTSASCPDSRVCSASVTNPIGVQTSDGVTLELDLVGIVVGFDANIADGLITSLDGGVSVIGQNALLDLCGTVDVTGASVTVSIDGGAAQAASVSGTAWCRSNVTLSAGDHTVAVVATDGVAMGAAQLDPLTVDVVGPDAPTGALVITVDREAARLSWTAPASGGPTTPAAAYVVKVSTAPFTAGNFDASGVALPAPTPSAPGQTDEVTATRLRAGTGYHFAVIAVDAVGNRSGLATAGPHQVDFARTGRIDPTLVSADRGWDFFGSQVAGGDFDGDGLGDLAVSAPYTDTSSSLNTFADGVVYVYLGASAGSGIDGSTPTFVIQADPAEETGRFGFSLTALDWNGDGTDDLAAGAPFQNGGLGRVSIFLGGSTFAPGAAPLPVTLQQTADAGVTIETDGGGAFFSPGRCGYALAAGRFDAEDARDDLALSCVAADGGRGGVLVLHGGATTPGTIVLSDSDGSAMGDLRVHRLSFAGEAVNGNFGRRLHALAPLGGAADVTSELGIVPAQAIAPNKIYLVRGRTARPPAGITALPFDAGVDLQLGDGVDAASSKFGESLGTIGDLDGDGRRELVVPDYQAAGGGQVTLVDGDAVGTQTIAAVQLARITGGAGIVALGSAVVNNRTVTGSDVDDDGVDDLIVAGRTGGDFHGHLYVWYGGAIPASGTVTAAGTVDHVIAAPSDAFNMILTAEWIGDVDGDGLADLCYGDPDVQGGKLEVLHR